MKGFIVVGILGWTEEYIELKGHLDKKEIKIEIEEYLKANKRELYDSYNYDFCIPKRDGFSRIRIVYYSVLNISLININNIVKIEKNAIYLLNDEIVKVAETYEEIKKKIQEAE